MVVAAPLLVLSRPVGVFLWAFPRTKRPGLVGASRSAPASCLWRALSGAVMATILRGVALWAWHLPAAFDATLVNEGLHTAQYASFLVGALFFWWAMREQGGGLAVLCLFATSVHGTLLGALLTIAPRPLYAYVGPVEDQQLNTSINRP